LPGDGSVTPAGSCGSEAELASPGGGVRPPGVRPREPENCELGVGGGRELISRVVLLQSYFCVAKHKMSMVLLQYFCVANVRMKQLK